MRMGLFFAAVLVAATSSASCIHGYVRTAAGAPVTGATVTLLADQKTVNEGTSNGRGWFRVDPKRRGDFGVLIVAEGYAPQLVRAAAGKDIGVVTLTPARPVVGTLRCKGSAMPESAIVFVGKDGAELAMTTDITGAFRVADPAVWVKKVVVSQCAGGDTALSYEPR
ncbi:MAG TPA: carboxypeptidase-like regulatory domain-containing protein [Thermoanaerobaculia bacterium]|nr:carboxypeptidase-like regulatory domain-containing protein [Thermoanaerobaculia bacterium]